MSGCYWLPLETIELNMKSAGSTKTFTVSSLGLVMGILLIRFSMDTVKSLEPSVAMP